MCIPSVGDRGVARTAVVLVVLALAGSIVLAALVGAPGLIGVPGVLLAVERLAGTQPEYLRHEVAPCNHLSLFMGRRTLEQYWPRIVRWMKEVD